MINSLIDGINGSMYLPKMVIMLIDMDILKNIAFFGFSMSLVIGKVMGYLVNTVNSLVDDRFQKLRKIKDGVVIDTEPRIVWVSLLTQPHYDKILSLKCKYNEVLEETLTMHKGNYFLDVEGAVKQFEFDRNNHLSCDGHISLWRFIDQHIKRFDRGQLPLEPRKVMTEANRRQKTAELQKNRFLLPRPPPMRRN